MFSVVLLQMPVKINGEQSGKLGSSENSMVPVQSVPRRVSVLHDTLRDALFHAFGIQSWKTHPNV